MKYFISTLIPNILGSFKGKHLWFHIAAIALTVLIVLTGFDWYYFDFVHGLGLSQNIRSAVKVGGMIPIILPLGLIIAGLVLDRVYNRRYAFYGAALAQAAILGSLISSTYKAFTGRVQPMLNNFTIESSYNWNFGFWEYGIFWGWPSSHTTIAFSMAFCLIYITRKNLYVMIPAIIYALYIGIGTTYRIHWFSEFVAGALIGAAIGMTVGKHYAASVDSQKIGE